ncbi:hypothetical protein MKX78_21665 [Cytobacillus sp. FSL R5-0569]|uniref:hypothetical protein n=1 Tax=Cytobacillus TaxID=2675230 RepID=UPI002787DC45|nr:hypothetical protein [Cytobacillus kochii]MDQ0185850.1 hypothetical protein [Cytobacillus kochii]
MDCFPFDMKAVKQTGRLMGLSALLDAKIHDSSVVYYDRRSGNIIILSANGNKKVVDENDRY